MSELDLDWNPATFTVMGVMFSKDLHEIVLVHFENKLNELRKVLNAWFRRSLTHFGKITVFKLLVISRITRLLLKLPDPEDNFLNNWIHSCTTFYGVAKTNKIKRSGMCQGYEIWHRYDKDMTWVDWRWLMKILKISWLRCTLHVCDWGNYQNSTSNVPIDPVCIASRVGMSKVKKQTNKQTKQKRERKRGKKELKLE